MSNKIKYIDAPNHTYYFFDDIININNFNPNKIKADEKLYKSILIYYIGYVTVRYGVSLRIQSKYWKIRTRKLRIQHFLRSVEIGEK